MNNEDAQAIKHAVAAGIRAAQHMCPHCGTPWTLWQRRGYDKHPCDEWRITQPRDATGHPGSSTGQPERKDKPLCEIIEDCGWD